MRAVVFLAGLSLVTAVAASSNAALAHRRITTTVTWDREISAILSARCVGCHRPGGRAPMPLTTYAEARPWARAIRYEVVTRRMPVWHAARGYGDFANDPSLSAHEIALIAAWADGGAPQTLVPFGSLQSKPQPSPPLTPARAFAEPRARTTTVSCGAVATPTGTLLGFRPAVPAGGELRVVLEDGAGAHKIIGWVRGSEPRANIAYWLRDPLTISAGDRLLTSSTAQPCVVSLMFSPALNQRRLRVVHPSATGASARRSRTVR